MINDVLHLDMETLNISVINDALLIDMDGSFTIVV